MNEKTDVGKSAGLNEKGGKRKPPVEGDPTVGGTTHNVKPIEAKVLDPNHGGTTHLERNLQADQSIGSRVLDPTHGGTTHHQHE
jgi:hypothetical protein